MKIDLTRGRWQLAGYRPNYFHDRKSLDHRGHFQPQWGPIPAVVPGSAQTALRKAKVIPDWNVGTNSLLCEWVEHYQWEFRTELKAIKLADGERAVLHCDGLDYSGWIAIDHRIVGEFKGALVRHRFDLTEQVKDGQAHVLSILFAEAPAEQGQIGATSKSRYFKPRFNYSWDWCPRFVPVGIWDRLWLEVGKPRPRVKKILTSLAEDLRNGSVTVFLDSPADIEIPIQISGAGASPARIGSLLPGQQQITIKDIPVEPWYPNGRGKQPLYRIEVGDDYTASIGFKRVRWLEPMVCEVNGKAIFLQGVNWTPIQMDYHSITPQQYKQRIELYLKMGCNMLRVWGGAYLEREVFYDLCDKAGLLVWQEFPLSSSGPENYAPTEPEAIEDLKSIATDYIQRRGHHACKLLWCGGNELQSWPDEKGNQYPLTASHPALAAMKAVVEAEDPGIRFLPTSPSGPVFYATPENVGKNTGLHLHVHGPWNHDGPFDKAVEYWSKDDANFRSETGMPGASSYRLLKKYAGKIPLLPATAENPLWAHTSLWWLPKNLFTKDLKGLKGDAAVKKFVRLSQEFQARILSLASNSCKKRFPDCGAFIIWMGHDAFPTQCNTSIVDFEGNPKPAYDAVAKVFRGESQRRDGHT